MSPANLQYFHFLLLQSKGVRLIVVAVGPDSRRQKFQDVLERMAVGGKDELHFLDDFANSKEATNAITKSLCREYLNKRRVKPPVNYQFASDKISNMAYPESRPNHLRCFVS